MTSLKLGRVKTGNTFFFKSASVSSKHAEIVWDDSEAAAGGTWYLVDLGSTNGTQLNGNSKCLEGAQRAHSSRWPDTFICVQAASWGHAPCCAARRHAPPLAAAHATPRCSSPHPPGQRYPLRDQDVIHLGPDTQLQVTIAQRSAAAAAMTVEQKLTADAERVGASIQVRVLPAWAAACRVPHGCPDCNCGACPDCNCWACLAACAIYSA